MAKFDDVFGEEPAEVNSLAEFDQEIKLRRNAEIVRRRKDKLNEIGTCPPVTQDIIDLREKYKNDFISMHKEVFTESTGVRPFGKKQENSIQFGLDVFKEGGRLLKLEPRGYAKTTRITNEALAAVLLGMQDYIVIICSNQEKAEEILESLKTEVYNNDNLLRLFPATIAAFRHIEDTPIKALYQTYEGVKTYLKWGTKTIRFPSIPGEASSGKFIEVRPMSNVKGLHKKIKAGPDAGKVFRPTLFLIDDPQTHDDAKSETAVKTIISRIKRDALRGGSHSKRASAIMSITPVLPGDVAWHFERNEHSWDIVKYKMLEEYPDEHDWWMDVYAKKYLDYDRSLRGDRTRAALEAMKLVQDNYERVHAGSEVTWDHAFAWDEDPQTEISPVQHAYNIILDDGMEDFEYECQCNTEYGLYEEGETLHAPIGQIITKVLPYKRGVLPQKTSKVVAHIDVNKEFLSFVVLSSPNPLQPHCIDYGTHPKQPGLFSKRNLMVPLPVLYPHKTDYRDVLYLAVKDLIEILATRTYVRDDGNEVKIDKIGVDIKFEESYVSRAIKESLFRNMVVPCSGVFVGPDDDALHEKAKSNVIDVWDNCFLAPNRDHTLDHLNLDVNFFKTEVHRGFNLETGIKGSLTLFGKEADSEAINPDRHKLLAEHCNAERPMREIGKKSQRTRVVWKAKGSQIDNEWFDNLVNCYALLYMTGLTSQIDPKGIAASQKDKETDMAAFMAAQATGRNL